MQCKILLNIFFIWLLSAAYSSGCTIFYVFSNGMVLAGNNEDWKDPYTKFWIYPPTQSTHGWIKFGFGSGFPQGGMNEHGLFWDATGSPYLAMPVSEANKTEYPGPLMQKIMEECATVEDALAVFENYYCEDQYRAQYLLGDSTGASMIVEGDDIIMKSGDFQVLTNFYQSHPELGGYPCWRYETAVSMLGDTNQINPYRVGEILAATHQEGTYPTQYSMIYDLTNQLVYLFYYHNYEEFIVIDLKEEMNNMERSYDIPKIFSEVRVVSPLYSEQVSPEAVLLKWQGKKDSNYEVYCSMDPDFSDCTPIPVDPDQSVSRMELWSALVIIILASANICTGKGRKFTSWLSLLAILTFCTLQCEGEKNDSQGDIREFSVTMNDLSPGVNYYWKVGAHTTYSSGFNSESLVYSFSTQDK